MPCYIVVKDVSIQAPAAINVGKPMQIFTAWFANDGRSRLLLDERDLIMVRALLFKGKVDRRSFVRLGVKDDRPVGLEDELEDELGSSPLKIKFSNFCFNW
jgi:hypothetical protein